MKIALIQNREVGDQRGLIGGTRGHPWAGRTGRAESKVQLALEKDGRAEDRLAILRLLLGQPTVLSHIPVFCRLGLPGIAF